MGKIEKDQNTEDRIEVTQLYSTIGGIVMGIVARFYLTKLGFKDKVGEKDIAIVKAILKSTLRKLEELVSHQMQLGTVEDIDLNSDEFTKWLESVE